MKRKHSGVTLMELMVALAILGILLGLAVPTFREFSRNNRVAALQNELVTTFNLARSEALKRSTPVAVCASVDGGACATEDDWAAGWIVFTDATGTLGDFDPPGDELLQRSQGVTGDMRLAASAGVGTAAFVQFQPNGTTLPDTNLRFDVYWEGCGGERARNVTISPIGTLQSAKADCP